MGTIRFATEADAPQITLHRHAMFAENGFASEAAIEAADRQFEPWVRARILDGRYVGLLLDHEGAIAGGAGVFFADFPPHWIDPQPVRAYVLNVYVSVEVRSMGYARQLIEAVLALCHSHGVPTVVLHASPMGRPVYERMGFKATDEMMLKLNLH